MCACGIAIPGSTRAQLVACFASIACPVGQVSDNLDIVREDTEEEKVAAIQTKIRTGDEIWVKVIDVKPGDRWGRGPKVGCSIKACERNHSSGRDSPDTHRRRSYSSASSEYDGELHRCLCMLDLPQSTISWHSHHCRFPSTTPPPPLVPKESKRWR